MWRLFILLVAWTNAYKLEQLSQPMKLGEGPHWDAREQALYFVEIKKNNVWRYHPESRNLTTCHIPEGQVTVIVPVKGQEGKFVVGVKDNVRLLSWDGRNGSQIDVATIISPVPTPDGGRTNDGKVDSMGRFWIGTIGREENGVVDPNVAGFFKIECNNGTIEPAFQVGNVTVSNGIAWTAAGTTMYYVDSPTRKVDAFDFEPTSGAISNRKTVFDLDAYNISGVPDGMTIDKEDNLWVALYGGEGVIHVRPSLGTLINYYRIPGNPQVTSVSWGGPDLDALYITSAETEDLKGGQLYRLTETGAGGRPANDFVMPQCGPTA